MGQAEASFWSIDRIVCSAWHEQNHTADIYISNYQGDSIDFQVVRTPDGDIVPFNITSDFRSSDWYEHTSEQDGVDSVINNRHVFMFTFLIATQALSPTGLLWMTQVKVNTSRY